MLKCGKNTAVKTLEELSKYNLIEKKRQGLGKPNLLYVKHIVSVSQAKKEESKQEPAPENVKEEQKSDLPQNTSASQDRTQEFCEEGSSYNTSIVKKNNNYSIYHSNNNIHTTDGKNEKMTYDAIREFFIEQLDWNNELPFYLSDYKPSSAKNIGKDLEYIFDVICDTYISPGISRKIRGNLIPGSVISSRLAKLTFSDVTEVYERITHTTNKVSVMSDYVIACLFTNCGSSNLVLQNRILNNLYGETPA